MRFVLPILALAGSKWKAASKRNVAGCFRSFPPALTRRGPLPTRNSDRSWPEAHVIVPVGTLLLAAATDPGWMAKAGEDAGTSKAGPLLTRIADRSLRARSARGRLRTVTRHGGRVSDLSDKVSSKNSVRAGHSWLPVCAGGRRRCRRGSRSCFGRA
jgi:hypothetical protein